MARFNKDDPGCHSEIVFVGNVGLRSFTETSSTVPPPHATAELVVDILASPSYLNVEFREVTLIIEVKSPSGVQFVDHSRRNNYRWGVPSGSSWDESNPGAPTNKLRIRWEAGSLLSGPLNGRSHYVGVHGLPGGSALEFSAVAAASRVTAATSSCPLRVDDLHVGERLAGYLG
ncbi:DEAD/DEAH box helicase [Streptomyces azureus]|uniref:DEAD/DEAH box helicase n=1 Tax=Streptomyces azureus TaxID=146537 RepID=A0A0K8PSK0_STRAJ|nr:DEAD/DEAH box helicase [Streptomyces azureus]